MLADSPEEPPIPKLGAVREESEDGMDVDSGDEDGREPVSPTPVRRRSTRLSLVQELDGGAESDDEIEESDAEEVEVLIRGKAKGKERATHVAKAAAKSAAGRAVATDPKTKSRAKAASPRGLLPKEKENARRSPRTRAKALSRARTRSGSSAEGESSKRSTVIGGGVKKTRASTRTTAAKPAATKSSTPATVPPLELEDLEPAPKGGVKLKGKVRGGARRVPIDSSEAAPSLPAWRG